ncbi:MAG: hypothetical protein JWQ96_680 [Segetibacter sp.]|nr:hypothetical protein [Segetibacter sp.]
MLNALDILFTFLHFFIVGFNLLGWIWKRTRRWHFAFAMLTIASWFILGIWYGIGYCPVTDWQWDVKEQLGVQNLPASFIEYYAEKITGHNFDPGFINAVTLITFLVAIALSVYFNFFRKADHKHDVSR